MGHLVHFTNNIDGSLSRMTKTSQTVSHKLYNLNVDEDCVMYSTSELIMCFIDGFTSGMNSQSIASLQIESAHIYEICSQATFKNTRAVFFPKLGGL